MDMLCMSVEGISRQNFNRCKWIALFKTQICDKGEEHTLWDNHKTKCVYE